MRFHFTLPDDGSFEELKRLTQHSAKVDVIREAVDVLLEVKKQLQAMPQHSSDVRGILREAIAFYLKIVKRLDENDRLYIGPNRTEAVELMLLTFKGQE